MEYVAQIIKSWYAPFGELPVEAQYLVGIVLMLLVVFAFIQVMVMFAIWLERKVSAHMQDRLGPMFVGGWHGWAQSPADGMKLLVKEDIIPRDADRVLFKLAPFLVFLGAFAALVPLPWGQRLAVADLNIGVLYVVAISSLTLVGIIMAGWASNNKYSLFGGMRSAAQIVAYEIPTFMAILTVVVCVGSLSLQDIVESQRGGFWHWWVLRNPFTFVAFFIYYTGSLAEVNRTPFDISEAESELVAGYHTEYSGMRFALFFLAEYANMFTVSAIATALFLGGWHTGIPGLVLPGPLIFIGKAMSLVFVQMWLRWTLPRLRVDQLLTMCWKYLLPISFVLLVGACFWTLLFYVDGPSVVSPVVHAAGAAAREGVRP